MAMMAWGGRGMLIIVALRGLWQAALTGWTQCGVKGVCWLAFLSLNTMMWEV